MKKVLYLMLLLFIGFSAGAKQAPGYIVLSAGDTIWVQFLVHGNKKNANFTRNQEALVYYDQQGKKQYLMPAQAKAAGFVWGNDTIRVYSLPNTVGIVPLSLDDDGFQFFDLKENGKVKLFSFVEPSKTYHAGGAVGGVALALLVNPTSYFLQYEDQPLVRVRPMHFKEDMADFFREHDKLVEKIYMGTYTVQDLAAMVREYNAFRAQDYYEAPEEAAEGF